MDVDFWAADKSPDWSFQLDEVNEDYRPASPNDIGTTIEVVPLHPSVAGDFALTQVLGRLRTDLQLRHQPALETGGRSAALVRDLLQIATSMGVEAIAEGIEVSAQRDALVGLGCRLGQGFLLGFPADPSTVTELFSAQATTSHGPRRRVARTTGPSRRDAEFQPSRPSPPHLP